MPLCANFMFQPAALGMACYAKRFFLAYLEIPRSVDLCQDEDAKNFQF